MSQSNDRYGSNGTGRPHAAGESGRRGAAGGRTGEPAGPTPPELAGRAVLGPRGVVAQGGGALKGIGEKFATNPVTGTGKLTIPLPLSPGRSGFTPALELDYDSGAGNGPYGLGWSVGYSAITRRTDQGLPQYLDGDRRMS